MNQIDIQPGVAVVNHDYPKHRCPLCNHVCYTSRPKLVHTGRMGRTPTARDALLDLLRTTTWRRPIPGKEIRDRLGISKMNLTQLIYRTRLRGYPIQYVWRKGYYLAATRTDARQKDSETLPSNP